MITKGKKALYSSTVRNPFHFAFGCVLLYFCLYTRPDPVPYYDYLSLLRLDLLLQQLLQGDGVRRELGDALAQLLHRHLVLVEVEAEERLVVQVAALGDVQRRRARRVQLLGHRRRRVVQFLQQARLHGVCQCPDPEGGKNKTKKR